MKRFSFIIASACCALVLSCGPTQAEEAAPPKLEPPQRLQPYTDVPRVLATAKEIIQLLSTAKFASDAPDFFTNECDTPRNHSIVRGYELAKTSYYLFASKMEIGWYDATYRSSALSEPYRGALAATWIPEAVSQAISVLGDLRNLPSSMRADLRAFLADLLRYRTYENFLRRASEDLELINGRIGKTCSFEKRMLIQALQKDEASSWASNLSTAQRDLALCEKGVLSSLTDIGKAYRELINANRDPDAPELSNCLDGNLSYYNTLVLGAAGGIRKQSVMAPNHFLIGFWMRRRAEGSGRLAEFVIGRAIEALKD